MVSVNYVGTTIALALLDTHTMLLSCTGGLHLLPLRLRLLP